MKKIRNLLNNYFLPKYTFNFYFLFLLLLEILFNNANSVLLTETILIDNLLTKHLRLKRDFPILSTQSEELIDSTRSKRGYIGGGVMVQNNLFGIEVG
ncbi:hypothetical protein Mgra_00008077 [Meloidogyne graminicola]|uniref:Uncharacterized protein n=1 Tax=Meloidogyne graminicola TaxID=189291 RepID=A0A8S9ZGN7_9BILA|nr:hypothetical protein Mgra_00008077 [Meloidogyne graminicola]